MQTLLSHRPSSLRLLTVPLIALGLTLALLWTVQPLRTARAQTFTVTKIGDNTACPATDQRGVTRPQGVNCDIGAVEAAVTTPFLFVSPTTLSFNAVAGANPPPAQVFTVTNSGVGPLAWTASESTSWFSLDNMDGLAPSTVNVSLDTTGLAPGSYNGNITVSADGAGGSPQTVTVTLTVINAASLLWNGDFEAGRTGWSESSSTGRALIRHGNEVPFTSPRSGSWAAVLGEVDGETSDLSQTVNLPEGDDLSLIYYTYGHSTESQCDLEVAKVRVNDVEVATHPLCQSNNSSGWTMQTIDLNAYRGQSISLHFVLKNDPLSDPSTLLIDDVRLQLGDQPPPQTQWDLYLPAILREEMPVTACVPSPQGESENVGDALTICPDQTVNGAVSEGDLWDVYKIAIDANRSVAIELLGNSGDADLLLFPPGTTDILQDAFAYYSAWTNTSNESIQGATLVGGDWYVAINAFAGSTAYQLKATIGEVVAPPACTPSPAGESNNVNDALTLCSGQPASGEVSDSDEWDVYRVHFADNTGMRIELSGSGGDAAIGLYGPSATDVVANDPIRVSHTAGTNDERIVGIIRDPGGWYVAVRAFAIEATNYTLQATAFFVGEESAGRERREQRQFNDFDLSAWRP